MGVESLFAKYERSGIAMTEQDLRTIGVVRRMYTGDEAERRNIAQDIVWQVPGHNAVSGEYHGFDEYTQLMPARMAPSLAGNLRSRMCWSSVSRTASLSLNRCWYDRPLGEVGIASMTLAGERVDTIFVRVNPACSNNA
jgi:hypothetical protein